MPEAVPTMSAKRRTYSLAQEAMDLVREVMDRRRTRRNGDTLDTLGPPFMSPNKESKSAINPFPNLVLQIMRGEFPKTSSGEIKSNEDSRIPHVQADGGKLWKEFDSRAMALEKDLQSFQNAVKELGSSLELTGAARNMRKSVSLTAQLFQENAKNLFPKADIPRKTNRSNIGHGRSLRRTIATNFPTYPKVYAEDRPIYVELKAMADGVKRLRLALDQFLEFRDREEWPLMPFESYLNEWSSWLESYEGQFQSREVRMFVHGLSGELGDLFEDISLCLKEIIDSVPTVRLAQEHFISNLHNLTTVATFFSAVTATTIQYSFMNNGTGVAKAVNIFWFNSLVFSIASALNSFLVLTWRRATYSSPHLRIPWWLWLWIRQCPPVFLLVSVVAFLAGLGCFVVSSNQALYTYTIVIVSEVLSGFGLAALLVWLARDKWISHRQGKTPLPVLRFARTLREKADNIFPSHHDHSTAALPTDTREESVYPPSTVQGNGSICLTPEQRSERARQRWRWAFSELRFYVLVGRLHRGKEIDDSWQMNETDARLSKLALSHELERPEPGTETNDIQFHPHGKALAICKSNLSMYFDLESEKITNIPHRVDEGCQVVWTSSAEYLVTRKRFALHTWPLSEASVTPSQNIMVNSHYILQIPNPINSEGFANHPPRLLSIEATEGERPNTLAIIDISGKKEIVKKFKKTWIQHLDIFPDGKRVLIAAIYQFEVGDPFSARKLMVFNLAERQIEHEVPVWHEVQHVTLSFNGRWAVVTYQNDPPPQLWFLKGTPYGVRISFERQFCARERISMHEFDPRQGVRFTGRGHFIGRDRVQFLLTADGTIHVWRRDKPHPVHIHGGLTLDKDKPVQIACNRASDDFMFATRSHDGTVRIWKALRVTPRIKIDTTRLSPVHSRSPSGHTKVIPLARLTESPQDELPGEGSVDLGHTADMLYV